MRRPVGSWGVTGRSSGGSPSPRHAARGPQPLQRLPSGFADIRRSGLRPGAAPTGGGPAEAQLGRVARGGSANLLGAIVMAVCLMGLTVVITRVLSPEDAGVFFSATSLFVLATAVGQLGTNTGLVYFLSRARANGTLHQARRYGVIAMRPVVITAVVMGAALFALAPQLSALINPEHVDQSTSYLRALAFFIPLVGVENVALAATRGLGSMRANVLVEQLGRPVLQLALVIGLLAITDGRWVALAWVAAYLPAAVVAAVWWRRAAEGSSGRRPGDRSGRPAGRSVQALRRDFWRFSGPRALASVGQSAMQRFDIVLVGALAGASAAAVYTAATRFVVAGQMGSRAISLAVQPRLGYALGRGDVAGAQRYYLIGTAWLMLVTWPLYLTFVVWGDQILTVFGSGYSAGQGVLLLLSMTMLLAMACGMVDMVLNMAGRSLWSLANIMLAAGVQFGLDVLLIPSFGVLGAAIGWSAALVVANLVPLVQIGVTIGLRPWGRPTLLAAVCASGSYGAVSAAVRHIGGSSWAVLVLALIISTIGYAATVWALRRPLELMALQGALRLRRGRSAGSPTQRPPDRGASGAGQRQRSGSPSRSSSRASYGA
ncbi:MAG: oligosaccharide flippase family protein [Angustibacter sp.]